MGLGFVIGRAGTGKTRHCLEQIKAELRADPMGPPVYWVVPRQATFSTERMLLNEFGPFTRCRVVSFDQIVTVVLGSTGGSAAAQITPRGRQMILGLLLRQLQNNLTFFASSARRVGLSRELDRTFSEVERSGKFPADLVATLETAIAGDPSDADTASLLTKSRDLALIYDAYISFLGPERLDPHRRLQHVLTSMSACPAFRNSTVYIDGFTHFNRHERQMIVGLAQACQKVTVTMLMDPASPLMATVHVMPDEMGVFFKVERCYRQLAIELIEAGVKLAKPIKLTKVWRFASKTLELIERRSFDGEATPPAAGDDAVERIEAPDRIAEVDAVARRVRSLLTQGRRFRDIVVLVRDLPLYEPLIAASFREHGITYFVDARRSAAHHPLLQWVRAVLLIARRNWPHEEVMALLKTGLSGVTLDQADEIENYVLLHGIIGQAWEDPKPWEYAVTTAPEDDVDREVIEPSQVDQLRRTVVEKLGPFLHVLRHQPRLTFKQICMELFRLFDAFNVRATMAEWIKTLKLRGELEAAAEHEQTWANLVELFDEMVDLLGEHEVSTDEFVQTLEAGLESFDFALTPPTLDQVTVGEIERSRTVQAKIGFVLGLAEGLFPKAGVEANVLTDSDRSLLRRRSIELDDDTARLLLDERLLGYLAFTRPSEKLILTRPFAENGGKPLNASPFWQRFDDLIEGIAERTSGTPCYAHDKPDCIATPRQLVTGLMRWARRQATGSAGIDPTWAALYQAMSGYAPTEDPITKVRRLAWRALSYSNEASVSPAVAERLFPSPLHAGVSQIETFASCPFKHFIRYGLQLKSREVRDFTHADVGQAYHRILEEIVRELVDQKKQWRDLNEEQIQQRIHSTAEQIAKEIRHEVMISNARNRYLLKRIERTLSQVIASARKLAERQTVRPYGVNVKFGHGENVRLQSPWIQTPKGRSVVLHGRMDRVDRIEGTPNFTVIDYKTGSSELRLQDVYHGLALQLLAYMLVLRESGGTKLTPIAAFYLNVTRSLQNIKHPEDAATADSDEFLLRVKPRGIFDEHYIHDFDSELEPGERSVAVPAYLTKENTPGMREQTDVADREQIDRLLDHVKHKIATLGDDLMSGHVQITPYRLGDTSPCPRCDYRTICRFEVGINKYHTLQVMKKSAVLEALAPTAQGAADV